ncbi:MAG: NUDIX domain-containing protein, partial [Bacteroidota bacterium]
MYVIYINDRPLTLLSKNDPRTRVLAQQRQSLPTHLTAHYTGKPRTILNYADMLEKGSPKVTAVDLLADNAEKLWEDFRSHYRWLPAAGGVVKQTASEKYLFIFRRGYWDLPKGKIDAGEDAPTAAVRDFQEETGLTEIKIGPDLPTTYHTYRNRKEKRVLKPTYWFRMETEQTKLTPQTE